MAKHNTCYLLKIRVAFPSAEVGEINTHHLKCTTIYLVYANEILRFFSLQKLTAVFILYREQMKRPRVIISDNIRNTVE